MGRKAKDIKGKRFYNLVVIDRAEPPSKSAKSAYWLCKCDCGKETTVASKHLTSGGIRSCGCNRTVKMVGMRFDRLVVLRRHHRTGNSCISYLCICDCGNLTIARGDSLRRGEVRSCGCYHFDNVTTHGMTKTRLYSIWQSMKQRCFDVTHKSYKYYVAKGVVVCDRWKNSFIGFRDDMYSSYLNHVEKYGEKDTTLDRIDVNGNYEPSNCRWATWKEQQANKREKQEVNQGECE